MKIKYFLFSLIFIFSSSIFSQSADFNRGVNLTNWFQAGSAKQIQFSKYTKTDFERLKSLGVDVVRLPINLHFMTLDQVNYELDPLFLQFLDKVVDWCEELNIHLLLDNHTFDVESSTPTNIDEILIPVWQQMAAHFKNRSNYIYYEILNEPHGISDLRWNQIQQSVVKKIREIDTTHTIVVGPASWNSFNNLANMPVYEDKNLIYTFHFYDPFVFTHQGAGWSTPSMASLRGVPFPYDANRMPDIPSDLIGSWVDDNLKYTYPKEGNVATLKASLDKAIKFSKERNVKIYCGEFGVLRTNAPTDDRVYWYEVIRKYLEENNIAWTIWDYKGGFGLYKQGTAELFDYNLNIPLVEALGFNAPDQKDYNPKADSTSFGIYGDFIMNGVFEASSSNGNVDYYNSDSYEGQYSLKWSEAKQYTQVGFKFSPTKDLTKLLSENYSLSFWLKGNGNFSQFDIRFVDTKTDVPEDHPWRSRVTIVESDLDMNNVWKKFEIPLISFTEQGAYDNNTWYNPEGKFDWSAIDKLEFVSEYGDFSNTEYWIDNLFVLDPLVSVKENETMATEFELKQNYPNPFNPSTTIEFKVANNGLVKLKIFDVLGREIKTLLSKELSKGAFKLTYNANNLPSGLYLYRLEANGKNLTRKMMLLK